MHPRVGLHQIAFMGESTVDFLDHVADIGVRNVTLVTPRLEEAGAIEAVRDCGIPVASINHPFAIHPDLEKDSGEAAEELFHTIEMARRVHAPSIYLITGGRGALSWEEAAERFSSLIAPCADAARAAGIDLLVENASALNADIHIAHTFTDTIRLAEQSGVGICIELHACWAESGLYTLFRRAMPYTGLVQVSDYVLGDRTTPCRAVPGDGTIPLESLIGDILRAGYRGIFDLELIGPRIAEEGNRVATKRAAIYLSEMLDRLGA